MNADPGALRNRFAIPTFCKRMTSSAPLLHTFTSLLYSGIHMQAIQILTTGSADVLTLRDLPTPTPAPREALIRIEASGVNFIDTYFPEARYPAKLPYPLVQQAAATLSPLPPHSAPSKP